MNDDAGAQAGAGSEAVLFKNRDADLRIARSANGTFELALNVHGEEITAYDLTADMIAAIGAKLMAAVSRPARGCPPGSR